MKSRALIIALLTSGLSTVLAPLNAQTSVSSRSTENAPPNMSEADIAWLDLTAALATPDTQISTSATPEQRLEARAARAARMKRNADLAQAFAEKYPEHVKVGEARVQEVLSLLNSRHAGDATVEGRLVAAVQKIAEDKKTPAAQRVRAVAALQFSDAMRGKASKDERLAKIEIVARSLTVMFPSEPQGFESLMTVATAVDSDEKAKAIASEVANGNGPFTIRQEAKFFSEKLELIGQPISAALGKGNAKAKAKDGKVTVIYSWATWSPGSITLAAKLQARVPGGHLIGINLDTDASVATKAATEKKLVGEQEYDERGRDGAVAQSLKLRMPGQVIIVDAQGVVREVRAELDLERALSKHGI